MNVVVEPSARVLAQKPDARSVEVPQWLYDERVVKLSEQHPGIEPDELTELISHYFCMSRRHIQFDKQMVVPSALDAPTQPAPASAPAPVQVIEVAVPQIVYRQPSPVYDILKLILLTAILVILLLLCHSNIRFTPAP